MTAALAVACLTGSHAAGAAEEKCPSQAQMEQSLSDASGLMQQGDFRGAVAALGPPAPQLCDPRASLLLAGAYEASGDLPSAEQTLLRAHAAWPANNSIAASLARQYMAQKQVAKAAQALAHFHPTPATPIQELQLAVLVFIESHQLVAAHSVAQAAYKAAPSAESLVTLANTLQLQGKFKDVVALLNPQRSQYAGSAAFLITLAESEYDSILYDAARDDLQRALALDAASYQAHYLLGNAWMKLGNTDEAIAEYQKAVQLSPDQPRTYTQLALALESKQDQAGAAEQLVKALTIDGHYGPALIEVARIDLSQNRATEAVQQLNIAIEDNPHSEQAYFLLAKAYGELGDKEKSEEAERQLVSIRNSNWKHP
jgi:tetratricopeptide (TPR) repeat protein